MRTDPLLGLSAWSFVSWDCQINALLSIRRKGFILLTWRNQYSSFQNCGGGTQGVTHAGLIFFDHIVVSLLCKCQLLGCVPPPLGKVMGKENKWIVRFILPHFSELSQTFTISSLSSQPNTCHPTLLKEGSFDTYWNVLCQCNKHHIIGGMYERESKKMPVFTEIYLQYLFIMHKYTRLFILNIVKVWFCSLYPAVS